MPTYKLQLTNQPGGNAPDGGAYWIPCSLLRWMIPILGFPYGDPNIQWMAGGPAGMEQVNTFGISVSVKPAYANLYLDNASDKNGFAFPQKLTATVNDPKGILHLVNGDKDIFVTLYNPANANQFANFTGVIPYSFITPQGPQPADVTTAISVPSGGGTPRLLMIASRTQIAVSEQSDWTFMGQDTIAGSTISSPFTYVIEIPVKCTVSALRASSSGDLGKTWSVGADIGAKLADGTPIADGASGAEVWTVTVTGYYEPDQEGGLVVVQSVTFGCASPFTSKFPRATTFQAGADGSLYANGVVGDVSLQSDKSAAMLSEQWQAGKKTMDTTGRTGWRDSTTSNADAGISAYNPIWPSRGGGHGNRGAGGANTGPARLLALGIDGNTRSSDDCGDTWVSGSPGGQPAQSGVWFVQGGSTDGVNNSADDFAKGAENYPSMYANNSPHPIGPSLGSIYQANWSGTVGVGFIQDQLSWLGINLAGVAKMPLLSRLEELQYGVLTGRGWSWDQLCVLVISVLGNHFDNRYQVGLPAAVQEIIISCSNAGQGPWTFVAISTDGCKTWSNVNPIQDLDFHGYGTVRDCMSGVSYDVITPNQAVVRVPGQS